MISKQQIKDLVSKKNINNDHFVQFLSYFFGYYENSDDRIELFNILNDDSNLVDLTKSIGINSRSSLLVDISQNCPSLYNNICLNEFIYYVYGYRAKGIGKGEYLFPFLYKNWKYSSDGDAMVSDDITNSIHKGEVKNSDGASLKPILASDAPDRGTIDKLNKSIFGGNIPFKPEWSKFCSTLSGIDLSNKFAEYFDQLFPVWSKEVKEDLCIFLVQNHLDTQKCDDYYSRTVFGQYKMYENQSFLIMLDDKFNVVIISDPKDPNLASLGVKFTTKMKRGRDTQAVPDGYVNIQLVDISKPLKRKKK